MTSRYRLARIVAIAVGFLGAASVWADGVLIEAGDQQGRGLARADGATCYVITAAHIVQAAVASGQEIRVFGASGETALVTFERQVGEAEEDLALLRVADGGSILCAGGDRERFRDKGGTHLVMRKQNGGLDFVPVAILHEGLRDIQIAAMGQGGQIQGMMSGSILVSDGAVKGLLIETQGGAAGGKLASVRSLEHLIQQLGPWVKDPVPVENLAEPLSILSRAAKTRPTGDSGQIAAIEQLVRQGSGLEGMDLGGLSFAGARLDHGEFAETILDGARLDEASFEEADLTGAFVGFASAKQARFPQAVLESTRFYFSELDEAAFEGARAAHSNWTGASARGADFRGADLTGASFHYADLTGADFRGAQLVETLFINAILTDARFEGARVKTLDVTAAIGEASSFDEAQRAELCGTRLSHWRGAFDFGQWVPDTTHETGETFRRIAYEYFPVVEGVGLLDPCPLRSQYPSGFETVERHDDKERVKTRFLLGYPQALLSRAGRGQEFEARFLDQLRRLHQALDERRVIVAPGPQHRAFSEALEKNLTKVEPLTSELALVREVLFVLAAGADPELISSYGWQSWAEQRLQLEQPFEGYGSPEPKLWPDFFPPDSQSKTLGPQHVELFKRWTIARAAAMPKEFTARLSLAHALRQRSERVSARSAEPFVSSLADLATHPVPKALMNRVDLVGPFRIKRDGSFEYVLAFPQSLDSYPVEVSLAEAQRLFHSRRHWVELQVRINGVEAVDREGELPKRVLVYHSELTSLQIVEDAE